MKTIYLLLTSLLIVSCAISGDNTNQLNSTIENEQEETIRALMLEYDVKGMGVGRIQDGELVWSGYYGEKSEGEPVIASTMFNVASTTKAVTAETFLRLAAKGDFDLDEPISKYYVYADLIDDPRHRLLTPRMILTHKTGFKNWPWLYEDDKLSFESEPGTEFSYSGIGFYILGRFMEEKLWTSFPHLVEETIFKPLGMENSTIVHTDWLDERIPTPVDREGNYIEPYNHHNGYWNPADDMHVTVEDFSKFLISSMNNDGLTPELVVEREKVLTSLAHDEIMGCHDAEPGYACPENYGHGIGWMVFDYGDGNKNLQHGGNDQGEASMAYFHTKSKNGLVVFCNGSNALFMMPKLVELLDQEQQYTSVYNHSFNKYLKKLELEKVK